MKNNDSKTQPANEWPNTVNNRDELDSALEAGLKSGISKRSIDEIVERARLKIQDG